MKHKGTREQSIKHIWKEEKNSHVVMVHEIDFKPILKLVYKFKLSYIFGYLKNIVRWFQTIFAASGFQTDLA